MRMDLSQLLMGFLGSQTRSFGRSPRATLARSRLVSRAGPGRAQLIQVVGPCLHHDATLGKVLRIVVVSADGVSGLRAVSLFLAH